MSPATRLKDIPNAIIGLICLFTCLFMLSLSGKTGIPIWVTTLVFAIIMLIKDIITDTIHIYYHKQREGATKIEDSSDEEKETHSNEEKEIHSENNDTTQTEIPIQSIEHIEEKSEEMIKTEELDEEEMVDLQASPGSQYHNSKRKRSTDHSFVSEVYQIPHWSTGNAATTIKRLPWKIVPFVVGMFIMVFSLNTTGLISLFARGLSIILGPTLLASIFIMCFLSALICNALNNQPMTILFTGILLNPEFQVTPLIEKGCVYAVIMGSNFGANFTLIGALAGIMWNTILSNLGIKITYTKFAKIGFITMPPVVAVACFIFWIEMLLFGDNYGILPPSKHPNQSYLL